MINYILDTNLFFNMEPGLGLGADTQTVVKETTKLMADATRNKSAQFYMPPRVVDEFIGFFDNEQREEEWVKDFLARINIKAPSINQQTFPAATFYRLVDDIRLRSYRGLTIAEEELKQAASTMMGKEVVDKKGFEMSVGPIVKGLRARYRQATRHGFLDSVADLDIITLAAEVDGFVVSCDEGVIVWAREFGVKELPAHLFAKRVRL